MFAWLNPTKLNIFLVLSFWLPDIDSLVFKTKIFMAYGGLSDYLYFIGESILYLIVIYAIFCGLLYLHVRISKKYRSYARFWLPTSAKTKLAIFLTVVAMLSYLVFVFWVEQSQVWVKTLFAIFLLAALLNMVSGIFLYRAGYDWGVLRLESILSESSIQSNGGPWVYHTPYFLIIPIAMQAFIWNYFLSCIIFLIVSVFRK